MADPVTTSAFDETGDPLYDRNGTDLARILASEAPDTHPLAQQMVGWTVMNRMERYGFAHVASAWANNAYAHHQPPTTQSLRIARDLLSGNLPYISQGAMYFYTPSNMPKEGELTHGWDVKGGLEQVPGVMKSGKAIKSYKPSFAHKPRIYVPGIPETEFIFLKG